MYITNWYIPEHDSGKFCHVVCTQAPPASTFTNEQQRTYAVGQTYTAQRLRPFGDGWLVVLHNHGKYRDGFDFNVAEFAKYFTVQAEYPVAVR